MSGARRSSVLPATAICTGDIQPRSIPADNGIEPFVNRILSPVRLRDARYERLVDTPVTENTGALVFRNVEPGHHLAEIVAGNQTTSAATPLRSANAGDIITAVARHRTVRRPISARSPWRASKPFRRWCRSRRPPATADRFRIR